MKAEILLDSLNPYTGQRLTTFYLVYPQNCHQHILTHRMFSRNAMSLRAISTDRVNDFDLVYPTWTLEKKGMTGDLADKEKSYLADKELERMFVEISACCNHLKDLGIHHQNINDYLRPFLDIHVILSATDFDNFFQLRLSESTKPDTRKLALAMKQAMEDSKPVKRKVHCPLYKESYNNNIRIVDKSLEETKRICAARLARYSYMKWTDKLSEDLTLANKLIENKHASPFEHIATASPENKYFANFNSWIQFRKELGL